MKGVMQHLAFMPGSVQNVTGYLAPLGVLVFLVKQQVDADTRGEPAKGIPQAHVFISLVEYFPLDNKQVEV
jgi:hypothetical protein